MLENLNGLVSGDTREVVEKLGKWVPPLEIVEECLDRDPRAAKDRGPPKNVGVGDDLAAGGRHLGRLAQCLRLATMVD